MLITKFNKMIKSKVILMALAFIIVLAFVAVPVASQMYGNKQKPGVEGMLNNKDVSTDEFLLARYYELGMRHDISLTPEESDVLRERTWQRLAALRSARALGVSVSNDEIAAYLQRDQAFSVNGQFNSNRYREILSRMNISEQNYEGYMRQDLILRKLADITSSTMWIPHSEAISRASNLMDKFVVDYIHMSASNFVDEVKTSDEDSLKYYDENKESFKTEKKVNVRYVRFPAKDYFAASAPTNEEVQDYYYANINNYSSFDTNNIAIPKPLDEVSGTISNSLQLSKALTAAAVKASGFVEAMSPKRYTAGKTFEEASSIWGLTINSTPFFGLTDTIPEIDADTMFNRIAFSLDAEDEERFFSDPILGQSNIYVIAALDTLNEKIPEYEEVKDQILPLVTEKLRLSKFHETATAVRESIAEIIKTGKKFEEVANELKYEISTTEPFSVYEGALSNEIEYADAIIPAVLDLQEGELSNVVNTEDGILIVNVAKRTPADALSLQAMKPQVVAMIERYRTSLVFQDWLKFNLAEAEMKDYVKEQQESLGQLDEESEEDKELLQ